MHTQLHTLTHVAPARGAAPRTVTSVQRPERLLADARDAEVAEELAVARPSSPPPTANVRRAFCVRQKAVRSALRRWPGWPLAPPRPAAGKKREPPSRLHAAAEPFIMRLCCL